MMPPGYGWLFAGFSRSPAKALKFPERHAVDSLLQRWTTGEDSRLWLIAGGAAQVSVLASAALALGFYNYPPLMDGGLAPRSPSSLHRTRRAGGEKNRRAAYPPATRSPSPCRSESSAAV